MFAAAAPVTSLLQHLSAGTCLTDLPPDALLHIAKCGSRSERELGSMLVVFCSVHQALRLMLAEHMSRVRADHADELLRDAFALMKAPHAQEERAQSITSLNLAQSFGGPRPSMALARAIRVCGSLTSIDLSRNKLTSFGRDLSGLQSVASAIAESSLLTRLDLSVNRLGAEGSRIIADCISKSSSLIELNLYLNFLGPAGALAISDGVASSKSIRELDLSANKMGPWGAKAIADGIARSGLVCLDLSDNNLTNNGKDVTGIRAIAAALAISPSLEELNLAGNSIGPSGAEALAAGMAVSQKLSWIDLSHNVLCGVDAIGRGTHIVEGINALAEALGGRDTITHLDVRNNALDDMARQTLRDLASSRQTFALHMYP
mmetsp:Transcript_16202/g.26992  ORF Transcript_16202/g.26992 Transcript_16202/m.26992 type:complete len:376 (+) Transcript_16202:75-1202(+)|eukprot:CAMPEP_0119321874 /NCGR_PEP_ID=MMETSP1333-20130426/56672_1 /TAXON_ID=418940 /ORGANISM="Scyphosphaera apsteinii, Strain RCC1455" /LENGTH=375 /DNA_ID=CAMNT_0007328957 /DNA_START=55 /DNA_END=1182 /DNA_ORIENTATION=+